MTLLEQDPLLNGLGTADNMSSAYYYHPNQQHQKISPILPNNSCTSSQREMLTDMIAADVMVT